ncbi:MULTISPECIES: condensation domain-containing protein [unclassified Streptomyces]|uniref:condensation domain-containing protein n=1 Tax=unclassified Streptomyces TaxID=2593676 RepID=UPI000DACC719|nr:MULTISPECIES: condensation domain-containing protein [unclassified Streptomyces]PZT73582.1 non-ribosomal peptide synthetase condensation domain protein [Streptomyces sp. AC1-42T]PZT83425.1 non-ribosomal peptide synthetase condensation domain protein [Streptomyces sp. AC1-42W]
MTAATADTTVSFAFAGGRAGDAPLTWGQRAIWHAIGRTRPNDHYFNIGRVLPLADRGAPVDLARLTDALAALVLRHEALRTVVAEEGGEVRQRLSGQGSAEVLVQDVADPGEAAAAADELLSSLTARRFGYADEWPVRFGAVRHAGRITHAVLALCHLAADGHAAEVLVRDLRLLVRRGSAGPVCADTPLDLGLRQASPAGRRSGRAALDHWERGLRAAPPTMFPEPVAPPRAPRFWTGRLRSAALPRAVDAVAAAHRVSGSTVLLAASAALVAAGQGHSVAAMMPIAGNRAAGGHRTLVSTLSQDALFVLRMDQVAGPEADFTDLLADAWPAALAGYRAAAYDPADWDALLDRAAAERGTEVHPYCCFNDMRLVERVGPPRPAPRPDELDLLRRRSVLDFPATQDRVACRYCLHVSGDDDELTVTLTADTAYLPSDTIHAHLRAIEEVVVNASAGHPHRLTELPALLTAARAGR